MKITPFSPGCGAVVNNLQLATLSDTQLGELRASFAQYGLLFFRDQALSPEDHLAFARRFGNIVLNKFFTPVPGYPQIAEVRKEKAQQTNIGGGWHTDHSYDSEPALGSLHAHAEQPQFTCKFNWLPGSVAFWDNRSTWHFAQNDYQGEARLMHRITLAGSSLEGAA